MLVKFSVVTLFPEALAPYLDSSMMGKAARRGIAEFELVNLRDFGLGPHRSVDDTPYGGGDGMLLRCEPAFAAIEAIRARAPHAQVIIPTPGGQLWTQNLAATFARQIVDLTGVELDKTQEILQNDVPGALDKNAEILPSSATTPVDKTAKHDENSPATTLDKTTEDGPNPENKPLAKDEKDGIVSAPGPAHFIILCPHYEGLDHRILTLADHQISLGKYILTGGELPALVIIDSIVRLLPGVLGGAQSAVIESFSAGDNLEYPQYTKPYDFRGMTVPDVLLSGDHGAVDRWRAEHTGVFRD